MATITVCDRCGHEGQLVPILGKEICNPCVAELRDWLAAAKPLRRGGRTVNRMAQAEHFIRRHGYVSGELVAEHTGDVARRVYHALRGLAKAGKLDDKGGGVFVAKVGAT